MEFSSLEQLNIVLSVAVLVKSGVCVGIYDILMLAVLVYMIF